MLFKLESPNFMKYSIKLCGNYLFNVSAINFSLPPYNLTPHTYSTSYSWCCYIQHNKYSKQATHEYYVIKNVTYFGSRWSKSRKHNSRVSCDRQMVSTSYNKHQQSPSEQRHQLLNIHPIISLQVRNYVVCSKVHDLTTSLLQGKILPMLIGEDAGWGPQLVSLLVMEYLPLLGNVCVKLHKHFKCVHKVTRALQMCA